MTVSHYKLTGTLRAEELLHIGSGRRTGVIKHSLPFIPGSFLRGAFGSSLAKSVCKLDKPLVNHAECQFVDDCKYVEIFEAKGKSSGIFFRYAYPLHLKCGGVYRPAAKTLFECENSQCGKTYDSLQPSDSCDVCGGKLKPYSGFVCDKCGERESRPIWLQRTTSTAIDPMKGSAAMVQVDREQAGTLHSIEAIPKGSQLHLEAIMNRNLSEDLDTVKALFERGITDEGVGGSRSRGYGKVSINDLRIEPVEIELIKSKAEAIEASKFSVQTLSPLILGGVLESKTLLEGARRAYSWAYHLGKPSLPEVTLENSRSSIQNFSGWSFKEGRRRRIESALSPGSVFQFKGEKSEILSQALAALEVYPLGSYKPHGCGELRIEKPR